MIVHASTSLFEENLLSLRLHFRSGCNSFALYVEQLFRGNARMLQQVNEHVRLLQYLSVLRGEVLNDLLDIREAIVPCV